MRFEWRAMNASEVEEATFDAAHESPIVAYARFW